MAITYADLDNVDNPSAFFLGYLERMLDHDDITDEKKVKYALKSVKTFKIFYKDRI